MTTPTLEPKAPETHSFQAEITQLLNLVVHSLYTDREIFIRELVSNANDALEKARHELLVRKDLPGQDLPLEIRLTLDEEARTFVIEDSGIGMTREEIQRNLGTIARSGTKEFLASVKAAAASGNVNLIGQFGVGFYSAFMVADRVVVESLSIEPGAEAVRWESTGDGVYTVAAADRTTRGTRITLHLKEDAADFARSWKVRSIVRKFSSFVPFPIQLGDEKLNTVQAIWVRPKSEITDEEYLEFYRFLANTQDEPRYRLHFSADAPLMINALLFVPDDTVERLGFGRAEPGVDLYCRRVMIQKHPEHLLPDWLRFVRGVVDSDDLPLNISRESMQDSSLIKKLSKVITKRLLKHLAEEAEKDPAKYKEFFTRFGRFIKEGITTDYTYREELGKLLRFESSKTEEGVLTSLDEYVGRMTDAQKEIYYVSGSSRAAIEAGPYIEALRERGYEVIYCLEQVDDFVFDQLGEWQGKKLRSADAGDLDLPELERKPEEQLTKEEAEALATWLKEHYGARISKVRPSKRLVNNPAVAVTDGPMTANMQRILSALGQNKVDATGSNMVLEINPASALIRRLHELRNSDAPLARMLADQLLDNALLAAGILADPRAMVDRLNKLLNQAAGLH
jgi:molecular chaperone HtpG